ncbi:hypothetical protein A2529_04700 [Candidatus Peribacteria bacterium RIFOXYD2_FULL_58_15]|nr:MAG: hypothetical protein A2529_04700 [Candidatus Peribacteria bacterium RIFOXYD2_FULL_58_15]
MPLFPIEFCEHILRPALGQRHLFDDSAHLFQECFLAQILFVTLSLLLGAAIVDVPLLSLGCDRAGTLSARHQFREEVLVLSPPPPPRPPRDHCLYIVKQVLADDRLVRTLEEFTLARNHSVVDGIAQQPLQTGHGEHIALVATQSGILEFHSQCPQRVRARRKEYERLPNERRTLRINCDSFRFQIVHVADRCKCWPFATVQLLANPALHVLAQVIHVVLALPEGDIEHELSLRRTLEPEAAELEVLERSRVQQIDDASSINTITRKAVRVPRQNALCLSFLDPCQHFGEHGSPRFFCGFGFLEGSRDFQLLFFCKVL